LKAKPSTWSNKLIKPKGSKFILNDSLRNSDYLNKQISKDGSKLLMVIKDVDREIKMLLGMYIWA